MVIAMLLVVQKIFINFKARGTKMFDLIQTVVGKSKYEVSSVLIMLSLITVLVIGFLV